LRGEISILELSIVIRKCIKIELAVKRIIVLSSEMIKIHLGLVDPAAYSATLNPD
jgi:hypothetical protein